MAGSRTRDISILAAGLAMLVWAAIPPDKVALDDDCEPGGGPAAFSAMIFRGAFWRAQLDAVTAERDDLLSQPARWARNQEEAAREARENPAMEERMMRLSREQERVDDKIERERREAQRQSVRLKRIAWLMACEGRIAQKLAE
jgi:hypothetical protein